MPDDVYNYDLKSKSTFNKSSQKILRGITKTIGRIDIRQMATDK